MINVSADGTMPFLFNEDPVKPGTTSGYIYLGDGQFKCPEEKTASYYYCPHRHQLLQEFNGFSVDCVQGI